MAACDCPDGEPHPVTGALFPSPVPAGAGWPDDPATSATAVATDTDQVVELAADAADLDDLTARQSVCRACPRLVEWRERVASERRRSFVGQPYWGRPVAGWGSARPRILIVGLAPAAHGGNRTGRIFTGDRSGDWLFAALHRVGLASQPTSVHAGDGQRLLDTRVVAAVRCAPPANKPTPAERDTCFGWLVREVELCGDSIRSIVALGSYAWDAALRVLAATGWTVPKPKVKFGHDVVARVSGERREVLLIGCYHPSQQNTFTGKLTEDMIDAVFTRATEHACLGRHE